MVLAVQAGEHSKKAELLDMLNQLATTGDTISVEERDLGDALRSPVSFRLEVAGEPVGITFSGVPGGHEFNSLILAVLQAGGSDLKLDEGIQAAVAAVKQPLHFEVFVSLSCQNCPDVVQTLNQFALLNDNISTEMIDGGVYPELVASRDIQGVPSVYLNGELFANGKVDPAVLLDKLLERYPQIKQSAATAPGELQDITVIGGGPAGAAAAIYAARKGLKVTMVAERIGGQVKDTMGIENLISVTSTTGPELAGALQAHIDANDIQVKQQLRVEKLEQGDVKTLHLSSGEVIQTRAVILATGARWRELGIPGEQENIGNGVAFCPHCDGPFFKGKDVVVVGGGNSGVEAALDLAGIVKSVTVVEFMPELKADEVLVKRAKSRDNITIKTNVAAQQIIADNGKVCAMDLQDRATEQTERYMTDGVFVQIGLVPNSQILEGVAELTRYGEVVIDEKGQTDAQGIFACGDVTTVPYKQIVVAMGEGAKAALAAFDYLQSLD